MSDMLWITSNIHMILQEMAWFGRMLNTIGEYTHPLVVATVELTTNLGVVLIRDVLTQILCNLIGIVGESTVRLLDAAGDVLTVITPRLCRFIGIIGECSTRVLSSIAESLDRNSDELTHIVEFLRSLFGW